MPAQRIAYLRYSDTLSLTSTSGALAYNSFRANGIYDPDLTGIGHQPMGHDQWAALFNHYVVLGSKITIRACTDTAEADVIYTGVYLADGGTVPYSSVGEIKENKKGTVSMYAPQSGKNVYSVSKYSAKGYYNVKDVKDNLDRLGSTVNADPSEAAVFHLWIQAIGTGSLQYLVVIDYIVLFSEPKELAQS